MGPHRSAQHHLQVQVDDTPNICDGEAELFRNGNQIPRIGAAVEISQFVYGAFDMHGHQALGSDAAQ